MGHGEIHSRRLLNAAEINEIAREQRFEIIRPEELTFETQVRLFPEASTTIAGPHGAGFANQVFAPRGAQIIEMIGPRYDGQMELGSRSFHIIFGLLGQQFVHIVGQSDESTPPHLSHMPFEIYTTDPAKFNQQFAIGESTTRFSRGQSIEDWRELKRNNPCVISLLP